MKKALILLLVLVCFTFTGCFTLLFGLLGDSEEETITVDTGVMQNVTRVTGDGLRKEALAVSPNGKSLLYTQYDKGNSVWELILLKDASLPAKTPLGITFAKDAAWYSDNKSFIYCGRDGAMDKLIKSNIDGGGKTFITRNDIGTGDSFPSIKGSKILCTSKISGVNQIVCLNDNGTEITILGEGESPNWHPTENKFVFTKINKGIFEMDLSTNQVTELYSDGKSDFYTPKYSSDGKYIVFVQNVDVNATGSKGSKKFGFATKKKHIFLMKTDGTNRTQLTNGNLNVDCPDWGTNNELFFISDAGENKEIWKAKVRINN